MVPRWRHACPMGQNITYEEGGRTEEAFLLNLHFCHDALACSTWQRHGTADPTRISSVNGKICPFPKKPSFLKLSVFLTVRQHQTLRIGTNKIMNHDSEFTDFGTMKCDSSRNQFIPKSQSQRIDMSFPYRRR